MKKIHTDKIRATFYIDKRLYQLLKRCSAIEGIPMSSIIENDILQERVGKYAYPSPTDWEDYLRSGYSIEKEEEENEKYWEWYSNSPEGMYESVKSHITKQVEANKITKERAKSLLKDAEKKFRLAEEQEQKEKEQKEKELWERWKKAVNDIPIE